MNDSLARANAKKAVVSITYFDSGTGEFSVFYDSATSVDKMMGTVALQDSNEWITRSFKLNDIRFKNSGPKKQRY